MGGPNLEIFKFTLYLVVPLAALIHFGSPEWYRTKVVPVGIVAESVSVFVFTFLQYRDKLFHTDRGSLVFFFPCLQRFIYLSNHLTSGYLKIKVVCETNLQESRLKDS